MIEGAGMLALETPVGRYFAPRSSDELAALLVAHPDATVLAGGTDVGLWVTKMLKRIDPIIYIGDVADLKSVREKDGALTIGAGVTYSDAHAALGMIAGDVGELVRRIGSRQIRNAGTVGGNIANGSPIGDTPPALIALGARIVLRMGISGAKSPLKISLSPMASRTGPRASSLKASSFRNQPPGCSSRPTRFPSGLIRTLRRFLRPLPFGLMAARWSNSGRHLVAWLEHRCGPKVRGGPDRQGLERGQPECGATGFDQGFCTDVGYAGIKEYRMLVAQNLLTKLFIETTAPEIATRLVGRRLPMSDNASKTIDTKDPDELLAPTPGLSGGSPIRQQARQWSETCRGRSGLCRRYS